MTSRESVGVLQYGLERLGRNVSATEHNHDVTARVLARQPAGGSQRHAGRAFHQLMSMVDRRAGFQPQSPLRSGWPIHR